MKILSAYFKNLAGIERASGLDEIFIDFNKCISNIILIMGPNGSGKSTILDQLHPLPDPTSCYISGREGIKILTFLDEDIIYKTEIIYPVKYDFSRSTTKAYITKIYPDGREETLNSNGNVTSYKDTIYDIFRLDPNFVSLTKLSMDDRGIVSKTTTERKKFVTSILESVEVYNDIFKTLSKRSSNFKSMINSITSKINTIGNQEELTERLKSLDIRINNLTLEKESILKAVADNEATVKISDPDNAIQNRYNELVKELKSYTKELEEIKLILSNSGYDTMQDCVEDLNRINKEINSSENEIEMLKSSSSQMLDSMNKSYSKLSTKQAKLSSLQSQDNIPLLKDKMSELIHTNDTLMKDIPSELLDASLPIYTAAMKVADSIIEDLNRIKEQSYGADLQEAVDYIRSGKNIVDQIHSSQYNQHEATDRMKRLDIEKASYERDLELIKVLDKRPNNCTDNNCPFIKSALEALERNPEENIKRIDEEYYEAQLDATFYSDEEQGLTVSLNLYNQLMVVFRNVDNNMSLLESIGVEFINRDILLDYVLSNHNFNKDKERLYNNLQYVNTLEICRSNQKEIDAISAKLDSYRDKISLIDELTENVLQLKEEVDEYDKSIASNRDRIEALTLTCTTLLSKKSKCESYYTKFDRKEILESKLAETNSKLITITKDMSNISCAINNINALNSKLSNINIELEPIISEKENIVYALKTLASYNAELEEMNLKYEKIETIKKYSSPNKGIQTLYMELYMGKTLKITNELLGMMFNGELTLLDYIINENEFRIPCKSAGSDIINDDISSCSSAQRSMISMIISLALSMQGSSKYNIVRTDEVDGPLDEDNRAVFIPTVTKMMEIMHIDQWFMISHSSESELSNVDIISLNRDYDGPGNVIFHY